MVWIKRAVIVLLALTLVNDGGRYLQAMYQVDERARAMAFEAAQEAKRNPAPDSGWPIVQKMAEDAGIEVLAYDQTSDSATVVARIDVKGTWVLAPAWALIARVPAKTPFSIEQRATYTP